MSLPGNFYRDIADNFLRHPKWSRRVSLSLWLRESRAQYLTKPLGQWLQSHPKEDEGAAGSAISNLNVIINQGNFMSQDKRQA